MRDKITLTAVATAFAIAASTGASAEAADWIDVLSIAESRSRSFGGSWKQRKGTMTGKATRGGRLEIPLEISGSYDLEVSLSRLSGDGFYGIRFPVGARSLALTFAANSGREDLLEGAWRSQGTGKTSATPSVLEAGKRREIRITVRQRRNLAKVTVTADGKDLLSWQGDTRKTCPAEIWGHTGARTLSLGLWNGSVRFDTLRVRVTDGRHRVVKARRARKLARFDPKKLPRGQAVGGAGGTPFRDIADSDGLLVGLSFRYSTKGGIVTLIPVFRAKDGIVYGQRHGSRQYPDEAAQTLLAKEGFAVGGVIGSRGTKRPIAGIRVVFMKVRNGKLDPALSYQSQAYGARAGGSPLLLGGDGRAVVGIEGRSGSTIEQLSLVFR